MAIVLTTQSKPGPHSISICTGYNSTRQPKSQDSHRHPIKANHLHSNEPTPSVIRFMPTACLNLSNCKPDTLAASDSTSHLSNVLPAVFPRCPLPLYNRILKDTDASLYYYVEHTPAIASEMAKRSLCQHLSQRYSDTNVHSP